VERKQEEGEEPVRVGGIEIELARFKMKWEKVGVTR